MANYLITGGAGFVGSQLASNLSRQDNDVILLDNMADGNIENIFIDGRLVAKIFFRDIREKNLVDLFDGVDTVFHFAGISSLPKCQSDPAAAYDNNVTGLANILEHSRLNGVQRIIFSSTSAVYENNSECLFSEDLSVSPDLVYSCTKLAGEHMCKSYATNYGMDIIIARFFNVYGEHQDINRTMPPFVSYLSKEVFLGANPILYNETNAVRDYVNVSDVIECLLLMASSKSHYKADVFNICSGVGFSVKQIVEEFSRVSGKAINPIFKSSSQFWSKFSQLSEGKAFLADRVIKEVHKNSIGDPSKTFLEFGFKPKVLLTEGLERVWSYTLKNLRTIK
jgi:nucleoside-diphosphate-sugar epimerase